MTALRGYIRHAEVYGTELVYETAANEFARTDLDVLARRLAAIDPNWRQRIKVLPVTGGSGLQNPHSNAEQRYDKDGVDPIGPPRPIRNTLSVCRRCGKVMRTPRARRYCSDACRQRAYRDRLGSP